MVEHKVAYYWLDFGNNFQWNQWIKECIFLEENKFENTICKNVNFMKRLVVYITKNDYLSYASRDINLFTFASVKGPLMISYYKAKIKHTKKA